MKITCDYCKKEICVPMFFSKTGITCDSDPVYRIEVYYARTWGKCICPRCGNEINKYFKREVSLDEIIRIATIAYEEVSNNDKE